MSVGIHSDFVWTSTRPTRISSPPGSVMEAVPSSTWRRRRWNCWRSGGGHGAGLPPGFEGGRTRFTLGRTTETSSRARVLESACSGAIWTETASAAKIGRSGGPTRTSSSSMASRSGRTRQAPMESSTPAASRTLVVASPQSFRPAQGVEASQSAPPMAANRKARNPSAMRRFTGAFSPPGARAPTPLYRFRAFRPAGPGWPSFGSPLAGAVPGPPPSRETLSATPR